MMIRMTTRCASGVRFWRSVVARVLAMTMIVSALTAHTCMADLGGPSAVVATETNTSDPGTSRDAAPTSHGLIVHVACGCHLGTAAPGIACQPVDASTDQYFVTADTWARPSPVAPPFKPPRA